MSPRRIIARNGCAANSNSFGKDVLPTTALVVHQATNAGVCSRLIKFVREDFQSAGDHRWCSYDRAVDSSQLNRDQLEQLRRQVAGKLHYLGRLARRMERLGFPPADPVYRAALRAHSGLLELHVAIHYQGADQRRRESLERGTGRGSGEGPRPPGLPHHPPGPSP